MDREPCDNSTTTTNSQCEKCGNTEENSTSSTSEQFHSMDDISEKECNLRRSTRKKKKPNDENDASVEYNLRDITLINRVQSERKRREPRQPKAKAKPPPLSKYRRRAANARERGRMVEINDAFEDLRKVLPDIEAGRSSKLTKITTLRLAMNYISALRHTLGYEDDLNSDASSLRSSSLSSSGDEQCLSPSDGELITPDEADILGDDNADDILAANIDLVQLDLDASSDLLLT
jgi:bHLH factor